MTVHLVSKTRIGKTITGNGVVNADGSVNITGVSNTGVKVTATLHPDSIKKISK